MNDAQAQILLRELAIQRAQISALSEIAATLLAEVALKDIQVTLPEMIEDIAGAVYVAASLHDEPSDVLIKFLEDKGEMRNATLHLSQKIHARLEATRQ